MRPHVRDAGRPLLDFVHCEPVPAAGRRSPARAVDPGRRPRRGGRARGAPPGTVLRHRRGRRAVDGGRARRLGQRAEPARGPGGLRRDDRRPRGRSPTSSTGCASTSRPPRTRQAEAARRVEGTLARLHESDARMAAVAEQLGQLGQVARAALAEADRLAQAQAAAEAALAADREQLEQLQARLEAAAERARSPSRPPTTASTSPATASAARRHEVDARLALRTSEERVAAVAARAQQLERAAAERAAGRARPRSSAASVGLASWSSRRPCSPVPASRCRASSRRSALGRPGAHRRSSGPPRSATHAWRRPCRRCASSAAEADLLKDSVHRDEVARAEQRMRIEQVQDKVLEDFGVEPDVLIDEYGPDQLVPPTPPSPGDERPGRGAPAVPLRARASRRSGSRPPSATSPCWAGSTRSPSRSTRRWRSVTAS